MDAFNLLGTVLCLEFYNEWIESTFVDIKVYWKRGQMKLNIY
jgi:hypothetical protein